VHRGQCYESIAAILVAKPGTVFRRITVSLVLPGLGSGTVLSFARCLGEFAATIAFAGSLPGVTRTLPLEVYIQREVDADGAIALSRLLVALVFIGVGRPRAVEGPR
jgi:molybdate transport system permease protein